MSSGTRVTIKVKDHGLAELRQAMIGLHRAVVEVGIQGKQGQDLLMKASVNEFGSDDGHTPERSFLRSTLHENRDKYAGALKRLARKVAKGDLTMQAGLDLFGQAVVRDVQRRIRSGIDPVNARATIAKKGSATPLIDSSQMINSIRHVVNLD